MAGIDRDRGCTIRFHHGGFRICMYKDAPGEYFGERGQPMSEKLAAEAGFDVKELKRQKLKNAKMAEARAKIEKDFASEEEQIEKMLSAPEEGWEVKHIGAGKYAILDNAGRRLTQKPLTREEAEELVDDFKANAVGGDDDGS